MPAPRLLELLGNTLLLAGIVVALAVSIGTATAWLTVRTTLPGRRAWSALVTVPLVLPAYVIAVATAMQESELRVLANPTYPQSYKVANQGDGQDHDSVGLFQQRPVSGWGTVEDCMDPKKSSKKFYSSLRNVSNWDDLPLTVAAQKVQGSAFPDHYAKHEGKAELVVESIMDWQAEKNGK